jgi:pimeloyl-ACP methyl ester carboxylesterase
MLAYEPRETLAAVAAPVTILVAGAGTADDEAAHDRAVALREVVAARATAGTKGAAAPSDAVRTTSPVGATTAAGTTTPTRPSDTAEARRTHVVTLAGTGHNLMRYRPDAVAGAIADLLGTAAR